MKHAVLRSIKPYWVYLICEGKKIIEIGKTIPLSINWNENVYIYCSKDLKSFNRIPQEYRDKYRHLLGKIVANFDCNKITKFEGEFWDDKTFECVQEVYEPCDFDAYGEYEYKTITTNGNENYKENWLCKQSCVSWEELRKYVGEGIHEFYGWHISDLFIYNKPKELNEFNLTRPPQTWCYVETLKEACCYDLPGVRK